MMKSKAYVQSLIRLVLVLGILILGNFISSYFYTDIDLTEDKRYTLNPATYKLMESVEEELSVEILLEGELPPSFRRMRTAVQDLLNKLRSQNSNIQYRFVNPLGGTDEENKANAEKLRKDGIQPVNLTITSKGAREARLVYPVALLRYGGRMHVVNLLEQTGGYNRDYTRIEELNASINLLEYKFGNAVQKLLNKERPRMVFLTGHGELQRPYTTSLEASMYEYYDIARLELAKVPYVDTNIHVVIIAKPLRPFGQEDLFKLDQYVMKGGKILWLIDALNMEPDSMGKKGVYMPTEHPLDIHNMLFTYGVRVNNNLVLDWESSSIPIQVGMSGNKPQIELRKWFYHSKAYPYHTPLEAQELGKNSIEHPIVQNLDFVDTRYPATIDTLRTERNIKKTPLLRSSKYSKVQFPPVRVSIEIIDQGIGQEAFKKENQNIAVLLEGSFSSQYKNRVSPEMKAGLNRLGQPFKASSRPTKMIVVSDGDIAKNGMNRQTGKPIPLGMNKYDGYTYGNKDFLMNCLEYLIDNTGIIAARNKQIRLRPLDQERAMKEEVKWQLINLVMPLFILLLVGLLYNYIRKRRFASIKK